MDINTEIADYSYSALKSQSLGFSSVIVERQIAFFRPLCKVDELCRLEGSQLEGVPTL